ncbi:MAG: CHAT domain-containing protein, partial [Chroococcales cyanobacterium]
MARKRSLFLLNVQSFLNPFSRKRWLAFSLIGLLSAGLWTFPVWGLGRQPDNTTPSVSSMVENVSADELLRQGKALYDGGQFTESAKVLQQAYQASSGNSIQQAVALSNLSLVYQALGSLQEAQQSLETSLNLLSSETSTSARQVLASTLMIQGGLYLSQGQAQTALETWEKATTLYTQLGDSQGEIRSRINQAQALQSLGFFNRALKELMAVKEILKIQPDNLTKVIALRSLGNVYQQVGNLTEARPTLQESLILAQRLQSPFDISNAFFSLGNLARTEQKSEEALNFYTQAINTSPLPPTKIQAQLNQLSLLIDTGETKKAETLALEIIPQLDTLPLGRSSVYAKINLAQSLVKLANKENNPQYSTIAQLLGKAVQQAQNLGDLRAESYALGQLGGVYEKAGQIEDSQRLTQKALTVAQGINAPDISYLWQWQLGRLYKYQGEQEKAIAAYNEAVNSLTTLRSDLTSINTDIQFSFRESVEPVYREFVGLLLDDTNPQISQSKQNSKTTAEKSQRIEQARKVIESLQLAELDNFFRSACLTAKPVQIDNVDQKAAVIYPIILSDRLEVVLSLPQQPLRHYSTFIPQEELEKTVEELQIALTVRNRRLFAPPAQQVYDWLIRPLEADLAESNVETLVFIPDGVLRNIPMAVLSDGEKFLIEKYRIAFAPGLELTQPQPLVRGKIEVLTAGLTEARGGFNALPNVEFEINEIQSQLPTEVLFNQTFTKSNIENLLEKTRFPVVHLATHGQFSSNAEGTFILTWDGNINVTEFNNILQSNDLNQENALELLVLSACETAKGDKRAALGLAGVAVRAGVRSTLATLWQVDDEATANLMSRFYQELANSEITKSEALRRAQLSILQQPGLKSHPYYWSPFILVGNWL